MRRFPALLAVLGLAACGHSTTVHASQRPVTMDLTTTERPVALDLLPADARTPSTPQASRDYRRIRQEERPSVATDKVAGRTGRALVSWYGTGLGTASGERFDPGALTFANKTMPFGTQVTFCHDGRCVTARCNDRGPFVGGRLFDLSRAAFAAIAPLGSGVVSVDWNYG